MTSISNVDNNSNDESVINLNVLVPYENQAGGHCNIWPGSQPSMLIDKNCHLLKPIIKQHGNCELNFYKMINKSHDDPLLMELKSLLPAYYGSVVVKRGFGDNITCITLENLTQDFSMPCVMDVKMGRRTWDLLASEEKMKNEKAKYAVSKQAFGFCITGFKCYDITSKSWITKKRECCRQFNIDDVYKAIKTFFNVESSVGKEIINSILSDLIKISNWMHKQTRFLFFSSSILIVYDAAQFLESVKAKDDRLWYKVKIIDLVHIFPNPNSNSLDDNFIEGLDNLIDILKNFKQ